MNDMKVGDLGRATHEEDQYDGCLVLILGEAADWEWEIEVLDGPHKGSKTGPWDKSTVVPLSALEQLAKEAEDGT